MSQRNTNDKVAVVTGGNKGFGLSLVRILCKSGFPGVVYLTARDEGRGRAALEQLKGEGLNPRYHQLDLAYGESIRGFAEHVKKEHGGLDVLIANGSIPFSPGMRYEQVEEAIRSQETAFCLICLRFFGLTSSNVCVTRTNNKGNAELCTTLLPLFRPDGRLLVVSSGFGQLVHLGPDLRKKFLATDSMGVEDLNNLLDDYLRDLKAGDAEQKGWPDWGNKVSKIGLVELARILDQQTRSEPQRYPGLLVNAVCPGWMMTDVSRPCLDKENKFGADQAKMPDEAAVDVVWLATLPGSSQPAGQLVQYRKVIPFEG
ncbi:carbonyl reductase [NADPH] 1-like [Littorina saxatilis]|uniref:carbonyl reductase [NADPH] 1-like n=1 Tax=Littorina saxatilis TaxID=31220 RepID=UPI0038B666D7